ncbi:restriction endonuclease subunit S [Staphylococcus equorum]|uniref:Type I restriction modification DNA specificity domain-containing protein n=1 Tax=Staphylococcus equorum TaxID=246432 RepID=A0AAP7IAC5_9STAP|nr:restriction endonuclease subunit S [Staphylococcus equorum]MDK9863563.1 restriction endonuclease subunit S [Staphylococcus equorum]OEK50953.1 hypothetical protein ASS94_14330 [Staphylococcus equorum]OEK51913.1 hypothetical protein ASS97_13290 [Staphylococcus equorum]OEK59525.1 hypothetical protein ASS99_12845 [Staphylococcus equorum]
MEFKEVKLGEISNINMGQSPRSEFYSEFEGTPFLQGNRTFQHIYPLIDTYTNKITKLANKNDILFSVRAPVGDMNIAPVDLCIGRGLCAINSTNSNQEFLFYLLKSKLNELESHSTGTIFSSVNKKTLENFIVKVPSDSHQKNIGRLLSNLDKKIEINQNIIANLEELSQTLFKRWFVDFEFPDENGNPYKSSGGEMIDSELGKIPKNWKVDEIGNYIKIKSGKRPKNKVDSKDSENVVPVIGASKIMGYTNDYIYNEKIIIIGRVGTHGVIQRFSTRTWPSDNTFVITSDFESIIYQLLKSIDYVSLNRGSTQPLLSQKDIKNTKVAMPTNETLLSTYQKENNHVLKMMDQKNIENQKLTQLRDTLLPKLMSGEIEIPDDIEVNKDELSI